MKRREGEEWRATAPFPARRWTSGRGGGGLFEGLAFEVLEGEAEGGEVGFLGEGR